MVYVFLSEPSKDLTTDALFDEYSEHSQWPRDDPLVDGPSHCSSCGGPFSPKLFNFLPCVY